MQMRISFRSRFVLVSWAISAERAPPLSFSKNFDFWGSLGLLLWHQAVCQSVALECLYFWESEQKLMKSKSQESSLFCVATSCSHEHVERQSVHARPSFPPDGRTRHLPWKTLFPTRFLAWTLSKHLCPNHQVIKEGHRLVFWECSWGISLHQAKLTTCPSSFGLSHNSAISWLPLLTSTTHATTAANSAPNSAPNFRP